MIELGRTKAEMLAAIQASGEAFATRTDDPASTSFTSGRQACLLLRGTSPGDLWPVLEAALSRRFAHLPPAHVSSNLTYLAKKGLGNAYKWGNRRDPSKRIDVEAVVTPTGAVITISDEGGGFDADAILQCLHRGATYFTHGGSGFKNFNRSPSLIAYADGGRTLLIQFLVSREGEAMNINGKKEKVSIVSYPKSGRTWLRVLIGKALCERFGLDEQVVFDKHRLAAATGLHISYTHEDAGLSDRTPCGELETDKSSYSKRRVVLLIRDPRDVLVSSYCHLSRRRRTGDVYGGSISEFIRSEQHGIRKIVRFYNIWLGNLQSLPATLIIRYEQMHKAPQQALRDVVDFIGADAIDDATLANAISYATFSNMKRLEEQGHFDSKKLKPGDSEDEESYKVRRGVVGGYGEYLGPEDCRYIAGVMRELSCAFYQP